MNKLEIMTEEFLKENKRARLEINDAKTKILFNADIEIIEINREKLERVDEFKYLI